MKILKKLAAAAAVMAISVGAVTSGLSFSSFAAYDDCNDDWLHASGSRLYDKAGNEVWLTGANWFGFNCTENVLHYLWSGDIDDMVHAVANNGINVLRIPVSTELLYNWMIGDPDPIESVNPNNDPYYPFNVDLINPDGSIMNSQQTFDVLLKKCKMYGVKVFIDIHSPESNNSGHNYGLWYGKGFTANDGKEVMVTTEVWQETLVWAAEHYKNDDTLLGFDLKNEPHSVYGGGPVDAIWDNSSAPNNWKKAAEDCANGILEVNPNALILIEGVEGYQGHGAWWGGNLRGVKDYPVVPESGTSQIVYSPHDYGPIVSPQTWFEKDFTEQTLLDDYWYDTWAYLVDEENTPIDKQAPLLIGEWGGRMDGGDNEKWMRLIRDYMIKHHINHTFWCLNDDSGDTGGLWKGIQYNPTNGTTIEWDEEKYELFEPSLWQTLKSGKYIGLDHKTPLGTTGSGISLNDFYGSYAYEEGSNLDNGTILNSGDIKPFPTDPDTPTEKPTQSATDSTEAPTEKPTQSATDPTEAPTEKPTQTVTDPLDIPTAPAPNDKVYYGDVDCNDQIESLDIVILNNYLLDRENNPLSEQSLMNANCELDSFIDMTDSAKLINCVAEIIKPDKLGKS